jgi:hypothetical protein
MYTPNRYLSLNASFMSVDPSGSIFFLPLITWRGLC